MFCVRCENNGLFVAEPSYGQRLMAICPDCDTGNNLFRFLAAVAKGEPVLLLNTFLTAGFRCTKVVGPNAVLAAPDDGDFVRRSPPET